MKINFIGLGKLGLPVAVAIEAKGHEVLGYDINPNINSSKKAVDCLFTQEKNETLDGSIQPMLQKSNLKFADSLEECLMFGDITFVAIQTPHVKKFGGQCPIPDERCDFNYTWLINCIQQISEVLERTGKTQIVTIISTVLPGTLRKYIFPVMSDKIKLCYNPFFIAMGTVINDFYHPEFILLGQSDKEAEEKIIEFYKTISDSEIFSTTLENAEFIKVSYNTFITTKVVMANNLMEMCHHLPNTDVDEISRALSLSNKRLISPAYLKGGMGDGGGCLPPGELIMTSNGMRPIETIKVGDNVLSHEGELRKVIKAYERDYTGDLIEVSVIGQPPVLFTSDHPMLVCEDGRKLYPSGRRDTRLPITEQLSDMEEKPAGELTVNQHYIPSYKTTHNRTYIDNVPEHITNDYCELAGWYLSEGSLDGDGIRNMRINISLHAKEKPIAEKLAEILKRISPPKETGRGAGAVASIKIINNKCELRYGSLKLGNQLNDDFGRGALNKFLPSWVLFGPEWIAKTIIKGLWQGDGHSSVHTGMTYSTISPDLAYGVQHILTRFGISSNLRDIPPRTGKDGTYHQRAYEVRVRNALYFDEMEKLTGMTRPLSKEQKQYHISPLKNDTFHRKVISTKSIPYEGKVHNIWVDVDHTYVTKLGAVHNCHPRDNIAMSWLSNKLGLKNNYYDFIMKKREEQSQFLADLIKKKQEENKLDICILGTAFKPETNLLDGSTALLLKYQLNAMDIDVDTYDPYIDINRDDFELEKKTYFIGCSHEVFKTYKFVKGSCVIDPTRYLNGSEMDGIDYVPIGIGEKISSK